MSDAKMTKLWHWISSAPPVTSSHSTQIDSSHKAGLLGQLNSKPLNIISGRNCYGLGTVGSFLPLQRLDSTGNQDPGYSYPPYKTKAAEDYFMGNSLHSQFQGQIRKSPDTVIRQSCFQGVLGNLRGIMCNRAIKFSSMPSMLDKSDNLMDSLSATAHDITSVIFGQPQSSAHISPMTVNCDSHASMNWKKPSPMLTKQSQLPMCAINLDLNSKELQIMSSECFNEVQAQNSATESYSKCDAMTNKCNMPPTPANKLTNPCVIDTESDSDCESDWSSSDESECDSEDETGFLTDDDCDSVCSDDLYSDTDSDGVCPWERITAGRVPWTCSKLKKTSSNAKLADTSVAKVSPDTDNENNGNHGLSACASGGDSGIGEETEVFDTDDVGCTVIRPECSNSHISYILGCSESDSDSEEDDVFSDVDQSSSNTNTITSTVKSCSFSSEDICTPPESACKIWDYFVQMQEPLLKLVCHPSKNESTQRVQIPKNSVKSTSTQPASEPESQLPERITKVRFSGKVIVHPMIVWSFAYRQARKSHWESIGRDQTRFQSRIECVDSKIGWCFETTHRDKVRTSRLSTS